MVVERKVMKRPDELDPVAMLKTEAELLLKEELGLAATAALGLLALFGLMADLD